MTEMILIGAGASKDAGLPLSNDLTKGLDEWLETNLTNPEFSWVDSRHLHAYRFCVAALTFHGSWSAKSPFQSVDVETVFNAIEMLANRDNLEIAPFVASWHRTLQSLGSANKDDIHRSVSSLLYSIINATGDDCWPRAQEDVINSNRQTVQDLLAIRIPTTVGRDADRISRQESHVHSVQEGMESVIRLVSGAFYTDWIFRDLRDKMIRILYRLLWIEKEQVAKVAYLNDLLQYCKSNSVVISSLNYDNCVELCADHLGIELDTGIDAWSQKGVTEFDCDKLRLVKMHGSVDWIIDTELRDYNKPVKQDTYRRARPDEMGVSWKDPALIFGGRNKLTAKGPFLELFQYFQQQLKQTDLLTVIGYSFRDDHINAVIGSWLNSSKYKRIRIVNGRRYSLEEFCEWIRAEENALQGRVEIINESAAVGIKALFSH